MRTIAVFFAATVVAVSSFQSSRLPQRVKSRHAKVVRVSDGAIADAVPLATRRQLLALGIAGFTSMRGPARAGAAEDEEKRQTDAERKAKAKALFEARKQADIEKRAATKASNEALAAKAGTVAAEEKRVGSMTKEQLQAEKDARAKAAAEDEAREMVQQEAAARAAAAAAQEERAAEAAQEKANAKARAEAAKKSEAGAKARAAAEKKAEVEAAKQKALDDKAYAQAYAARQAEEEAAETQRLAAQQKKTSDFVERIAEKNRIAAEAEREVSALSQCKPVQVPRQSACNSTSWFVPETVPRVGVLGVGCRALVRSARRGWGGGEGGSRVY